MPRGYIPNQMVMGRNGQHNYNTGFQQSQNLIPPQDYNNNGNLVHNNVNQNMLNESQMDYMLHIDSYDRDTANFPSQFKFVVSLGGAGTSTDRKYNEVTNTFSTIQYTGVPDPRIQRNFHNVKQVTLDKVFFPQYIVYTKTTVGGIDTYTGRTTISNKYRYLILKIKELDNNRVYSTNDRVSDDSFIIYKDRDSGGCSTEFWMSSYNKRTFLKSALKNLDKLSIEIVDPDGNLVKTKYVDDCDSTETEYDMPLSELTSSRQPRYEYAIQLTLTLCENEINTNVNYRY
jgi:hypothetical protein